MPEENENNNEQVDFKTTTQFAAHWEWTDDDGNVWLEPFIIPDFQGELERYLERFVDPDIDRDFPAERAEWASDFASGAARDYAKRAKAAPVYPLRDAPRPRLNVLFFPTMASQYAHIAAIFNNDELKVGQRVTLKTNVPIIRDGGFFFGVREKCDLDLFVVTKRPLDNQIVDDWNAPKGACLCVLVDWRYFMRGAMYAFEPFKQIPGWQASLEPEERESRVVSYRSTRLDELADIFDGRVDYALVRIFWTLFKTSLFTEDDYNRAVRLGELFKEGYPDYFAETEENENSATIAARRDDYDAGNPYLHRFETSASPFPENYSSDLETRQGVLQLDETFDKQVFREGAPLLLVLDAALACLGVRLYAGCGTLRDYYSGDNHDVQLSPRKPPRVLFRVDNSAYERVVRQTREYLRAAVSFLRKIPSGETELYETGDRVRDVFDPLGVAFDWSATSNESQLAYQLSGAKDAICNFFYDLLSAEDQTHYEPAFENWLATNSWNAAPLFETYGDLYAKLIGADVTRLARVAFRDQFTEDYRTFTNATSLDSPGVYYAPQYYPGNAKDSDRSVVVLCNDCVKYVHPEREKDVFKIAEDEEQNFIMRAWYLADVAENFMLLPERVILRFGAHTREGRAVAFIDAPYREQTLSIGNIPNPFILPIGNDPGYEEIDAADAEIVFNVGTSDIVETYPYTHVVKGEYNSETGYFTASDYGNAKKIDSHTLVTSSFVDYFSATASGNEEEEESEENVVDFYSFELPSLPSGYERSVASVVYRRNVWINGGDFVLVQPQGYGGAELEDGTNAAFSNLMPPENFTAEVKEAIQTNVDYPWALTWRGLPVVQLADEYLFNTSEYDLTPSVNVDGHWNRPLANVLNDKRDALVHAEVHAGIDLEEYGQGVVVSKSTPAPGVTEVVVKLFKDVSAARNARVQEANTENEGGWIKRLLVSAPLKVDAIRERRVRPDLTYPANAETVEGLALDSNGESIVVKVLKPIENHETTEHAESSLVLGLDRDELDVYRAGFGAIITSGGYYGSPNSTWIAGEYGKKYVSVTTDIYGKRGLFAYWDEATKDKALKNLNVELDFYAIPSVYASGTSGADAPFLVDFTKASRYIDVAKTTTSAKNPRKFEKDPVTGQDKNIRFGDGFQTRWKGFGAQVGALQSSSGSQGSSGGVSTVSLTQGFNAIAVESPLTIEEKTLSASEKTANGDDDNPEEQTKLLVIKGASGAEYVDGTCIHITDGTAADGTEGKKVINNTMTIVGTQGIQVTPPPSGSCEYTISLATQTSGGVDLVGGCGVDISPGTGENLGRNVVSIANLDQLIQFESAAMGTVTANSNDCGVTLHLNQQASGGAEFVEGCGVTLTPISGGDDDGKIRIDAALSITAEPSSGITVERQKDPVTGQDTCGYIIGFNGSSSGGAEYVDGTCIHITDGTAADGTEGKKVINNTMTIAGGPGIVVTPPPSGSCEYRISLAAQTTDGLDLVGGCGISIDDGEGVNEGSKVVSNTMTIEKASDALSVTDDGECHYTVDVAFTISGDNRSTFVTGTPANGSVVISGIQYHEGCGIEFEKINGDEKNKTINCTFKVIGDETTIHVEERGTPTCKNTFVISAINGGSGSGSGVEYMEGCGILFTTNEEPGEDRGKTKINCNISIKEKTGSSYRVEGNACDGYVISGPEYDYGCGIDFVRNPGTGVTAICVKRAEIMKAGRGITFGNYNNGCGYEINGVDLEEGECIHIYPGSGNNAGKTIIDNTMVIKGDETTIHVAKSGCTYTVSLMATTTNGVPIVEGPGISITDGEQGTADEGKKIISNRNIERSNAITAPRLRSAVVVGASTEAEPDEEEEPLGDSESGEEEEEEPERVPCDLSETEFIIDLGEPETQPWAVSDLTYQGRDLRGYVESETAIKSFATAKDTFVRGITKQTEKLSNLVKYETKTVVTGISISDDAQSGGMAVVRGISCQDGDLVVNVGYLTFTTETVKVVKSVSEGNVVTNVSDTDKRSAIAAIDNLETFNAIKMPESTKTIITSIDFTQFSALKGYPNPKTARLETDSVPIDAKQADAAKLYSDSPLPEVNWDGENMTFTGGASGGNSGGGDDSDDGLGDLTWDFE